MRAEFQLLANSIPGRGGVNDPRGSPGLESSWVIDHSLTDHGCGPS